MLSDQTYGTESMLKEERHQVILEELRINNRVKSSVLCKKLMVSEDTIRRDLNELAESGHLKKVHGGAVALNFIPGFKKREAEDIQIKLQIAQKALKLIKQDQVIIIDGGTSNLQLINLLPHDIRLTVITNSIPLANKLCDYEHIDGVLLGGNILKKGLISLGQRTIETLADFRADICFLGLTNIHLEFGLTEANREEAYLKKAIIQSADLAVSMLSSGKLNSNQAYRVGKIDALDILITELEPDHPKLEPYKAKGLEVL
jgi:DeoR/GlpR family transcriptional regulator of sugar metabolism